MDSHHQSPKGDNPQELVGYAIPVAFAALAASCQTRLEAFLALVTMVSIISQKPEWDFLERSRSGRKLMQSIPTLTVTGWLILIAFGVLR